jgi:hypothetical protein
MKNFAFDPNCADVVKKMKVRLTQRVKETKSRAPLRSFRNKAGARISVSMLPIQTRNPE